MITTLDTHSIKRGNTQCHASALSVHGRYKVLEEGPCMMTVKGSVVTGTLLRCVQLNECLTGPARALG